MRPPEGFNLIFDCSDSFHLLVAEVTHNETAEPSVNFHAVPDSPEGRPASCEQSASAPPEEFETHDDPSIESEPSPERLRTDKPPSCLTPPHALHESFSQLITSQHHPHEVELTALSLSNLTMCDDALTLKLQPEEPFRELESEQTVRPASEKLSVRLCFTVHSL